MAFYNEISKYYDFIFPVKKDTLNFIVKFADKPPKDLLDIACGTGGYSVELAKQGYNMTSVDLDNKMIDNLKSKLSKNNLNINAVEGNMLELGKKVNLKYDLAFCIGNSLVHLDGEKEIKQFLSGVKSLLKEKGKLVIQVINYDRVLQQEISSLPTIKNENIGLKFERMYHYDHVLNKIFFKTILKVNDETIENDIPLYPIRSEDLVRLLNDAGFGKIELFGDFKGNEFNNKDSYPLILVAYN